MNAIEIEGLSHRYGRRDALRDVSFTVPAGVVYALLGPNGAGKTTLLHILMGLRHAAAGRVRIFGKDRNELTIAERGSIAYVGEAQKLPGWMTLRQLEAYLAPMYPAWDRALAKELRDRFRLEADRKVGGLSRGETMKVALLCALAPRPRLLVMDEPFTGMDVAAKDELIRGLLLSAGDEGWTVLISSHDVTELETISDWVGYLDRGSMRVSMEIDALRERYRDTLQAPTLREIFIALANGTEPSRTPVEAGR